jgi:RNA polymerase sigma-70 factor, ECF subfamily
MMLVGQKEGRVDYPPLDEIRSDDVYLMRQLALKHSDALSNLYERYGRLVYSIAYNSVGDQAVAEEIVQDVFTRLWQKADTYDASIAKVSTWLISITRYRAIDELRKGRIRPEKTSLSWQEVSQDSIPHSPGPEEEMETSLEQELVREALAALSPKEREVLALAYFSGYTQNKIAEYLRLPLGTVKTRVRTGMRKLRLVLSQDRVDDPLKAL